MFNRNFALVALAALTLTAARPAVAQSRYGITDLGTLPGTLYSWGWQQTINDEGVVACYSNNILDPNAFATDVSFLWYRGNTLPLPGLPGAVDTIAFGINNTGQVVGRCTLSVGANHAVLWDDGAVFQLPELPGDDKSAALLIDDDCRAVGYSANSITGARSAVSWYRGEVSKLPSLPGQGGYDEALGINGAGRAIGYSGTEAGYGVSEHIALWDDRGLHDLGQLGGGWGDGYAINNRGQATGISAIASGQPDAFLWDNGLLKDLGTYPGDMGSIGLSINDRGQVVGASFTDFNTDIDTRAVLWEGCKLVNLQDSISADSGWTLIAAVGINNRGQIAGYGIHNGLYRDFLMTPK